MKRAITLILVIVIVNYQGVIAQYSDYTTQELISVLEEENNPQNLEMIYSNLINRYLNVDLDSMHLFAGEFLKFSREIGNTEFELRAHYNLGRYYAVKGVANDAINHFKMARELTSDSTDEAMAGRIIGMIGYVYYTDDQFDSAIEYYQESISYFERANARRPVAIALSTLGSIYYQKEDDEVAKKYYLQSLKMKEELKDSILMTSDIKNLALIYRNNDQLDSALIFLERALEIDEKTGAIHKRIGSYEELSKLHIQLGNYDSALAYAQKALELSEDYHSYQLLSESYEALYMVYEAMGDTEKALENFIQYKAYSDSVISERSREILIEERERNEAEKREKEIELLASQNELQKTRVVLISVVLGSALLIAMLVFWRIIYKKKKELELKEKDHELSESKRKLAQEELENEKLRSEHVQKELTNYALHIAEKNDCLEQVKEQIHGVKFDSDPQEMRRELTKMEMKILQNMTLNEDREKLESRVNQVCSGFFMKLVVQYPELTERDKRLAALIRLNLSSKEIASIFNIEPKSVEQSRYRLRKKMNLNPEEDLPEVLNEI
ncbi:MAG: tetratricopeptide repeat protein [Balneolaceae bacterium]|nr:tetratricopeptide repeat protein [Balneolaceae bacterium]MBO6546083.1 tetratricopeptide repeat protein [Balneolaceae bacterium]MBO6647479.1 tetratricopeptide repeat protein [Balneolaceae bacterium]